MNSKICKADNTGAIGCQDCSNGECPSFAPRCDNTVCVCGTAKPFNPQNLDLIRANTCSGTSDTDMFVCGSTGNTCNEGSVNPYCINDFQTNALSDLTSTCQVSDIKYLISKVRRKQIYKMSSNIRVFSIYFKCIMDSDCNNACNIRWFLRSTKKNKRAKIF